ncbi:undecaprenyl/decaprenyl-phosphate alpha-N-acetylglucosaminyl 1-phosphate transferase [Akkermansiaceae bacterium]|nr:undecaprenyl/decaprenyl-phosphate alpha-N-acetylglucosaminyl 1-phosphate transferase [Akkermansiaceae bacterium]MDB4538258.1 undecaprenyl/decaprenyl-phosphate alpha-N-acetylglucosaminyl 1-phosphate transferase [Akkermansiaceae bacterium]MDB4544345.1 undecaprenyl/decaprenyl-phosphate alpha-N-acetylglucosaminyl 1-phosphate transferase [Akkermansiaceae bacterium]
MSLKWFKAFATASLLLVIVGILDDRFGVNAWLKLLAHALSAVFLFYTSGGTVGSILGIEVPEYVDLAIWVIWTVAIINAFNLIDGMDGLCAGLAMISVFSLTVLTIALRSGTDAIVLIVMLGTLLGFLRYNFNPAKIFLGDTGSMFIGFFIASVALVSTGERFTAASLLLPLIVAGIPLIDVILAIWRRSFRTVLHKLGVGGKDSVFGADQHHLHHRLLAYGLTQRKVATILYTLAILGSFVALVPSLFDHRTMGLTVAALFVSGLIGFRYLAPVELKISGEVFKLILKRPARSRLKRFVLTFYDMAAILIGVTLSYILNNQGSLPLFDKSSLAKSTFIPTTAITLASCLFVLNAGKAQIRLWSRATFRDFLSLALWFYIGTLVATTINIIISNETYLTIQRQTMTFAFTGILLVLPRSLSTLLRESVIDTLHRNVAKPNANRPKVLLYGAGNMGELFLLHIKTTAPGHFNQMRIIGIIDDHPELNLRYQDGFKIRGGLDAVTEICQKEDGLNGIIVTMRDPLPDQKMARIQELCAKFDLKLYKWAPNLNVIEVPLITPSENQLTS